MNFKRQFMAKLASNISELDYLANLCSSDERNKKKSDTCSVFLSLAFQFDDKLECVQCDWCETWFLNLLFAINLKKTAAI